MKLSKTYFEKVSLKEATDKIKKFYNKLSDDEIKNMLENLKIPKRATKGSAGYDIYAPFDITLNPGETLTVPSLLKCSIDDEWFLAIVPRSGLGFKYKLVLNNTIGVIDSDYYNNPDNEGHFLIKMTNEGDQIIHINAGQGIAQGIFLPYGVVEGDSSDGVRISGFGSTTK